MTQPLSLPRVTAVEALDGFRLRLTFTDGLVREVDLANDLWGPMAEPLRDPATSLGSGSIRSSARSSGPMASTSTRMYCMGISRQSSRRRRTRHTQPDAFRQRVAGERTDYQKPRSDRGRFHALSVAITTLITNRLRRRRLAAA